MRSKPLVYSIILNWNQEKLTRETVQSVLGSNKAGFTHKILVVDNNSSIKPNFSDLNCECLYLDDNYGYAEGNNKGIEYALKNKAQYVFILNNDLELDADCLQNLFKRITENEGVGIVAPKIYFAKGYEFHKSRYKKSDLGKVIWAAGGKIDWDNVYGSNIGVDEVDDGDFDHTREIDFASGAAMLISFESIEKVGGKVFNPDYFMYLEDMDFSIRVKKEGLKIVYEPKALVWHKVSQSSGIGSGLNDYFITRNRLIFGFNYASSRTKLALAKEASRMLLTGRKWQKRGVLDFIMRKYGKGSWPTN